MVDGGSDPPRISLITVIIAGAALAVSAATFWNVVTSHTTDSIATLRDRVSAAESEVGNNQRGITFTNTRIDRLEDRMDRIEDRRH